MAEKITKKLKDIIKNLPDLPGIYKMLDTEGRVIYIGKAKSLKKRVKQYFQKNYQHSTRTKKLVEGISDITFTSVDTELEATILESNLIKQFMPKYNVIMKDGKSFVYIKITKEDFPRIQIVRKIEKDNAKYIGPKTSAHKVKTTLKLLKKLFPYRHCNLNIDYLGDSKVKVSNKTIKYPCLDYHIKRCIGPCIGKCGKKEYAEIIKDVENFLEGKGENIIKELKLRMIELAEKKEFEKAAQLRDKLIKVEEILEKQKISDPKRKDTDVINYVILQGKAYFNLFQIRDGTLIGQENFILSAKDIEEEDSIEVLEAFLKQYYEVATDTPREILIPHKIENQKTLSEIIKDNYARKTKINIPKKGEKDKFIKLSLKNAKIYADRHKASWQEEGEDTIKASNELQKILKIPKKLKRIECYDISHLGGTDTVGSMIVFENGAPNKSMYRKFKLRTVQGKPDDFKSMYEVLYRRFSRLQKDRGYKLKKARKKDAKKLKTDKIDNYYILEKNEKIYAYGEIIKHSPKMHEIKNIKSKMEEYFIRQLIEKSKATRIYINTKNKEKYLKIGFTEINKVPEQMLSKSKKTLVFEKLKHKKDKSFSQTPDLVIIDGGKGQLKQGEKVLKKLKIPFISLAKKQEEIFITGKENSIILDRQNDALKLIQRARDEAHRFAITYQKNLRKKRSFS